jgi:alpha-D-ribose 1-methylphosphonate 5-triphosphate diphosphatase PhnM
MRFGIQTMQDAMQIVMPYGTVLHMGEHDTGINVIVTSQSYAQANIDHNTLHQCQTVESTANLFSAIVTQNLLELKDQLLKVVEAIDEWKPE